MSSKHIAFFLSELHGGGAQRVTINLIKALSERGLKVDLVLAKAEGAYLDQIPPQTRLIDLQAATLLRSFPKLVSYLKQNEPEYLIAGLHGASLLAIWSKSFTNVRTKIAVVIHNTFSVEAKSYKSLRRRIIPSLVNYLYPKADLLIAVSQGVAQSMADALDLPTSQIKVIYNPVVTSELKQKAKASTTHPFFSTPYPVILGVGRLTLAKDFATLIRAFAKVRQKQEAKLCILGEGEDRKDLEALIKKLNLESDVSLPGFVNDPYAYMSQATLFVLSSLWEGLPTVLIEAMACGTNVVATDCPSGPREILAGGKYGKLVATQDSEALANAILDTIAMPINSEILRSRAEDFSQSRICDRYLEVFNN